MIDLILFVAVAAIVHGSFRLGNKYKTWTEAFANIKKWFADGKE